MSEGGTIKGEGRSNVGGVVLIIMQDCTLKTIDPGVTTTPGRCALGFQRSDRHWLACRKRGYWVLGVRLRVDPFCLSHEFDTPNWCPYSPAVGIVSLRVYWPSTSIVEVRSVCNTMP